MEKESLNGDHRQSTVRGSRPRSSFCRRSVFSYHHTCSQRGSLLMILTSRLTVILSRTAAGRCYLHALPLPHSTVTVSLRGSLYSHLEPWFLDSHPGNTSRSPAPGGQRGLHLPSHRTTCISLYIFAYFKRCCLRV